MESRKDKAIYYEGSGIGFVILTEQTENSIMEILNSIGLDISLEEHIQTRNWYGDFEGLKAKDIIIELNGNEYYQFDEVTYEGREALYSIFQALKHIVGMDIKLYEMK